MPFLLHEHYRNRARLSEDELRPYLGKHVAWNLEGTSIVASGDDDRDVFLAVQHAGYDPEQVVFSYVDPPDVSVIGGSSLRFEDSA